VGGGLARLQREVRIGAKQQFVSESPLAEILRPSTINKLELATDAENSLVSHLVHFDHR